MCLSEVSFDSFGAVRAVLGCIGIEEAGQAGAVVCFDGNQPVRLYWRAPMLGRSLALRAVGVEGRSCCVV